MSDTLLLLIQEFQARNLNDRRVCAKGQPLFLPHSQKEKTPLSATITNGTSALLVRFELRILFPLICL